MLPLMERKHYLNQAIRTEIASLAISCYVPDKGCPLYALAKQQNTEGIVANLYKANNMISLGLSQYDQNEMIYKGHVTLGVGGSDFETIKTMKPAQIPPFPVPPSNEAANWIIPELVYTVKFMDYNANGGMYQSVFKGLHFDKPAEACAVST